MEDIYSFLRNYRVPPLNNYETYSNLTDVKLGIADINDISSDFILDKEEECLICREEFVKNDKMKILNKCNHYFCDSCCKNWFSDNKKCPVCMIEY